MRLLFVIILAAIGICEAVSTLQKHGLHRESSSDSGSEVEESKQVTNSLVRLESVVNSQIGVWTNGAVVMGHEHSEPSKRLDMSMLDKACQHPNATDPKKWNAMTTMANLLEGLNAPWNIHGGLLLGLVRSCSIFDYDVDFVLERQWMQDHFNELEFAMVSAGFKPREAPDPTRLGKLMRNGGYEEKWAKMDMTERIGKLFGMEGALTRWQYLHEELDVPLDLFAIERDSDHYTWDLWDLDEHKNPIKQHSCTVKSTGTETYSWLGTNVKVPVPIEDALISLYGKDYIKPAPWVWNVQPYTVGSCKKAD